MAKVTAPQRELMVERCLRSVWSLQLCHQGMVYHGTKWQRWRLANPEGAMKEFGLLRQRKAAAARDEIARFWEQ